MVKLTLYGNKSTTCTQRVTILLKELELKYDFVDVDLTKNEQMTKEYLELNPFGNVPVIKYDTYTIFESRTILRYIAKNNHDYKDLTLDDSIYVDNWLEVESQTMNPIINKIVHEKLLKKIKDPEAVIDEELIKKEIEHLKKVLSIYEKRLSSSNYIGGDYFSIADISNIPHINNFVKCGYKYVLKEFPITYKWIKKIMSRESVRIVLKQATLSSKKNNDNEDEDEEPAHDDQRQDQRHDQRHDQKHDERHDQKHEYQIHDEKIRQEHTQEHNKHKEHSYDESKERYERDKKRREQLKVRK